MKKIVLGLFVVCFLLTGCSKHSENSAVKDLVNQLKNSTGYQLSGKLSVMNNDENYQYDIDVCYQKENHYKVTLTNTLNQHTQVILKNDDGVYVLTPSLNKSFKFQSDWPYQNSQIYLLDALIGDIEKDKNRKYQYENGEYTFQTKVNYPNNQKLIRQKIILDKNQKPKKVTVYQSDGREAMTMDFSQVTYSPKFSKDEFVVEKIVESSEEDVMKEVSALEDVIYPLFLPAGTKLVGEDRVSKENGERVIMTYDGDKSFVLVEETADVFSDFTIVPSHGEPYLLMDTLGVMTNNSLSWTSGGVEFYLVSDVMSQDEMIEVAQSISGIVSMK